MLGYVYLFPNGGSATKAYSIVEWRTTIFMVEIALVAFLSSSFFYSCGFSFLISFGLLPRFFFSLLTRSLS
jgi:hypothetical protein